MMIKAPMPALHNIFYKNRRGPDNWGQVKKLTADVGASSDAFGSAVSIYGDYAVVGASMNDDNGADSGSVYLFYKDHGGADNWGQVSKINANDGESGDWFGESVSISGNTIFIGSPNNDNYDSDDGSVYMVEF